MRTTRFFALTTLAVLLSLGVLGGVTRATTGAQLASGTPCASPMASPAASPMASPAASPMASPAAACAPASASSQTIEMGDLYFQPKAFTIPANTEVTVTLKNVGALPHNFNIDALNVHSATLQAGQTGTVTIKEAAGTYQYYCNQPGHKAAGMVGTLTIK